MDNEIHTFKEMLSEMTEISLYTINMLSHRSDITGVFGCLKSLATRQFVQKLVQDYSKENIMVMLLALCGIGLPHSAPVHDCFST